MIHVYSGNKYLKNQRSEIKIFFKKTIDYRFYPVYNGVVNNEISDYKKSEVYAMTENKLTANEIYTLLVNEICYLKHLPGDVLSESLLCNRFGLSRTPVRGVLQRLEHAGYVTISTRKGTTVTSIDFDIVSQMIYQRIAVETKVLIDFMKISNAYDMEAVNHLILESIKLKNSMDASPTDQQMMAFYDVDNNMHKVWFSSTNKLYIWNMFVRENAHYSRFKALDMKNKHNYDELITEHKTLFDMIRNKDVTGIEESVTAHLNGGVKRLGNRIFTDLSYLFVKRD